MAASTTEESATKRNVLILGGTGFIGLHLARTLLDGGETDALVLCDNLSRGKLDEEAQQLLASSPNVSFVEADLTRRDSFDALGSDFDHVYLLASMVGVENVVQNPYDVLRVNTSIIMNTLDWMPASRSRRLFVASTSETYAGGVDLGLTPVPTPESAPLVIEDVTNPRMTYALTKMWGEAAALHASQSFGFDVVIGRFHNVYGPRMGYDHVIPQLSQRILQREDPFRVYGADQTRAFCHVSDAVDAMTALMNTPQANREIVHIGDDREEIRVDGLLEKLLFIGGFAPHIVALSAPAGSVHRRCPDISKLRRLTGFAPRHDLVSGLAETFAWYQARAANAAYA